MATALQLSMAPPSNKRRKTKHQSSEEDEEVLDDRFPSFSGSSEEEKDEDKAFSAINEQRAIEEDDEGTEDDFEEEASNTSDDSDNGAELQGRSNGVSRTKKPSRTEAIKRPNQEVGDAAYAVGTFKSNVFKLQVDELLDQLRPQHRKVEAEVDEALHLLKTEIEKISAHDPRSIDDAERRLLKRKTAIPFPNPRPSKDAKYKLEYAKPASINVVGSYPLKTVPRTRDGLNVDMIVVMPASIFQDKDYLNHRYFYRRSYYLAYITATLHERFGETFRLQYKDFHDDPIKPVLAIQPQPKTENGGEQIIPSWTINIIPCIAESVFPRDKLHIQRNSIRQKGDAHTERSSDMHAATPFYNSSLRADMLMNSYLKMFSTTGKSCDAFKDACLLGRTWLRQRGFGSRGSTGGFGGFEWCALTALLLQHSGPNGQSLVSDKYSSYQLLKATLQVLAAKNISKQPWTVGGNEEAPTPRADSHPVIWDGIRAHNILYKMSPWSYKLLQQEARNTLSMLGAHHFESFDATFITNLSNPLYRFDVVIDIDVTRCKQLQVEFGDDPLAQQQTIYKTLQRALGDRVTLISIAQKADGSWSTNSAKGNSRNQVLSLAFIVNPNTVNRTVDHGPSAENKAEAASFREFWGNKAELRRFKDGSITESLVWTATEHGESVLVQIVRYILNRRFSLLTADDDLRIYGNDSNKSILNSHGLSGYNVLMESYKRLEEHIRKLDDLPLTIRQILPADPQLRYTSALYMAKSRPNPADVVLQFEGSTKWPDDLVAIQRMKIALLLKLGDLLKQSDDEVTARVGLENGEHEILNQAYLDVVYTSDAAFRVRIHHDREQTLLERQLKDKSLGPAVKELAALGLARYKRDFMKSPSHTQAVARLCSRHPALSGTIRLVKRWVSSHLLDNHIANEVIELFAIRTFVQPWPWQVPSSVQTGFLRTIFWLSRWDWRTDPLIVDMSESGSLSSTEQHAIETRFEAWRKLDPALNRVVLFAASNAEPEGTAWTDGKPQKVVAARMTALARAAVAEIDERLTSLQLNSLFASPLADFDFTLHLDPAFAGQKSRSKKNSTNGVTYKNLELGIALEDTELVGFDSIRDFLEELEELYGSAVLFFSGGHERFVIAGLWSPQTTKRSWRLNTAYSTIPKKGQKEGDHVQSEINHEAMLAEMARLGGDLVKKITVKER